MSTSRSDMVMYQMALKHDYPITEDHLKLIVNEATKMLLGDSRKYKACGMRTLMEAHAFNRRHEEKPAQEHIHEHIHAVADPARLAALLDAIRARRAIELRQSALEEDNQPGDAGKGSEQRPLVDGESPGGPGQPPNGSH